MSQFGNICVSLNCHHLDDSWRCNARPIGYHWSAEFRHTIAAFFIYLSVHFFAVPPSANAVLFQEGESICASRRFGHNRSSSPLRFPQHEPAIHKCTISIYMVHLFARILVNGRGCQGGGLGSGWLNNANTAVRPGTIKRSTGLPYAVRHNTHCRKVCGGDGTYVSGRPTDKWVILCSKVCLCK